MRPGLDLDGIGGRMAHAWGSLLAQSDPAALRITRSSATRSGRISPRIPVLPRALTRSWVRPGTARQTPRCWLMVIGNRCTALSMSVGERVRCWRKSFAMRPGVRGTLVDLPATVARSSPIFEAAGVSDRVNAVGQSFFDPLPPGADLYLLKNLLADWPDREATALLERRRRGHWAYGTPGHSGRGLARRRQTSLAGIADDGAGGREEPKPGGIPRIGSISRAGGACHRPATLGTIRRSLPEDPLRRCLWREVTAGASAPPRQPARLVDMATLVQCTLAKPRRM